MTTTYGLIPTSYHASPVVDDLESISSTKQRITTKAEIPTRRPWRAMFDFHSMEFPRSVSDAFSRIKKNLSYFQTNYVIVVLIIFLIVIFVNLLKHPSPRSLIDFTVLVLLWVLYFLCNKPIKVTYLIWYSVFAGVLNIAWALLIWAVLVLIHAVVRRTDDLFLDEEAATTETLQG